jgi:hypothetical protein
MMLALLAAATATCTPVPGADQLWADPKTRFVLVGESHGTNEVPAMFADLVCGASATRKVVVALEQPPEEQGAIDAFIESDGGAAAKAAFLKSPIWSGPFRDGRSSQAMLALFEQLRHLKHEGRIQAVVAFSDYDLSVPFSQGDEGINRGMAQALDRTASAHPDALVLGFAGSTHMSHANVMNTKFQSAAGRLPPDQAVSAFIEGDGGSAWQCRTDDCGIHAVVAFGAHHPRGVRRSSEYLLPGFDFIVATGTSLSASPPAVPLPPSSGVSAPK